MSRRLSLVSALVAAILLPAVGASGQSNDPRGIYVLGSGDDNPGTPQDERLANIRNYDFVSGYTLRVRWSDLDQGGGQYNFNVIDQAIGLVAPLGQHINLEVLINPTPQYVLNQSTMIYTDNLGNLTPVPWEPALEQAHAALMTALSNHIVAGTTTRLADNPTISAVDSWVPGFSQGIRDLSPFPLQNSSYYDRQSAINAVMTDVAASRNAFPSKMGYVSFFGFNDGQPPPRPDQTLISQLGALYNGPSQPKLSFFIENLSDNYPTALPGDWTGLNLQSWRNLGGETMMQANTSWLHPTPGKESLVASQNPATGINMAYNKFGTAFYELYVADIDGAANGALDAAGRPIAPDLRYWNGVLTSALPAPPHNMTWTGTTGNWTAHTWTNSPPVFPNFTSDAVVNTTGAAVTIDAAREANSLAVGSGQLTIAAAGSLHVTTNVNLNPNGTLAIVVGGSLTGGASSSIQMTGGTLSGTGGSVAVTLPVSVTAGTTNSLATPNASDTLAVNGPLSIRNAGTVLNKDGLGTLNIPAGCTQTYDPGTVFNANAGITNIASSTGANLTANASGGTLSFNSVDQTLAGLGLSNGGIAQANMSLVDTATTVGSGGGTLFIETGKTVTTGSLSVVTGATLVKTGAGSMVINKPQDYGTGAVLRFGGGGGGSPEMAGAHWAASVPEPNALILLAVAGLCLLGYAGTIRSRRRRQAGAKTSQRAAIRIQATTCRVAPTAYRLPSTAHRPLPTAYCPLPWLGDSIRRLPIIWSLPSARP